MKKPVKKILVEKFKNKQCSEADLQLLRNMSEGDEAIRQLLDLGSSLTDSDAMLSEKDLLKEIKKMNAKSRKTGRRARLLGDE